MYGALNNNKESTCFLVIGDQRALLIDSGVEIGDLNACVKEITSLPITVMNTYGHCDHSGGDFQFPEGSSTRVFPTSALFPLLKSITLIK